MPITPLHMGVLAPINHFWPNKVSNMSFILINLWLDLESIVYALFGLGDYSHDPSSHAFLPVLVLSGILGCIRIWSNAWIYGAFLGGVSHVILDMLVHRDMSPFFPFEGNPCYLGIMEPLSLVLAVLTVWFIWQCVSYILAKVSTN